MLSTTWLVAWLFCLGPIGPQPSVESFRYSTIGSKSKRVPSSWITTTMTKSTTTTTGYASRPEKDNPFRSIFSSSSASSLRLFSSLRPASSSSSSSSSSQRERDPHGGVDFDLSVHKVTLPKPTGLILEEIEDDAGGGHGVKVVGMTGHAAEAARGGTADVCVGDILRSINGCDVEDYRCWSLDDVFDIIQMDSRPVLELEFVRSVHSVPVCFQYNGVAIAARPGTPLCNLAYDAGVPIPYSCRSGSCGTCQQEMIVIPKGYNRHHHDNDDVGAENEKDEKVASRPDDEDGVRPRRRKQQHRLVRPCTARVSRDADRITILSSNPKNNNDNKGNVAP